MSAIFEKVALIIPRLATEHVGELVASRDALVRLLGADGLDLHGLADIVRGACAPARREQLVRSSASWGPAHRAWQAKTDRDRATWLAMYGATTLTEWEVGFVDSLVRQLGQRGATASPKQSARLGQIFARVSRAAA